MRWKICKTVSAGGRVSLGSVSYGRCQLGKGQFGKCQLGDRLKNSSERPNYEFIMYSYSKITRNEKSFRIIFFCFHQYFQKNTNRPLHPSHAKRRVSLDKVHSLAAWNSKYSKFNYCQIKQPRSYLRQTKVSILLTKNLKSFHIRKILNRKEKRKKSVINQKRRKLKHI